MANISRREFIKGVAASAVGVAGFGILGSSAHAEAIYTPGTYTASANGMGLVTMTATFDETSIVSIELDVANETPAIGQAAAEALIQQCLDAQSSEIDGVAGATLTSNAVKKCLDKCIAQAKGEEVAPAVTVKKAEVSSEGAFIFTDITADDVNASDVVVEPITEFAEEVDADIVVCGAGAAGVVAAVYAAEKGAKVAILQKESTPVSQGNCASAVIKSGSTPGGLKKFRQISLAFNSWRADPKLIDAYIEYSEDALKYLCEVAGVSEENNWTNEANNYQVYQWSNNVYEGVWKDATQHYELGDDKVETFAPWFGPKPQNFGTLVTGILKDACAKYDNLSTYMSTPVVQLVKNEAGEIVGCVGKSENGYIKFNAKAVILATGAYENNKTMVRRFCPDAEAFDKKVFHRTGDGNILAIEAGGVMEPVAHSTVMHDFDAGLMYDEPFLFVNMDGKRFMNEEVEMAYISKQLRYQPGFKGENHDADHIETGSKGWYCQIYDSNYMAYANAPVPEFVMARYLKEEDPSLHVSVFPELIDTFRADTLDELAEKLGVPADELKKSVERYNELCDKGEDEDYGKNSKFMNKIEAAPFWGTRRHIRCSSITAGVLTDENSMVITEAGAPIKGLYAAGNLGGQFFGAPDYPFFSPGLSLGHAVTFGYIAAKHAVENL